jgi:hypothetical protein
MEAAGSEGEKKKPPEGENKTKRKMKTASQLEILEKTYAGLCFSFLITCFIIFELVLAGDFSFLGGSGWFV